MSEFLGADVIEDARQLVKAGLLRERATGFVPVARRRLPGGPRGAALSVGRQLRADRRQLRRVLGTIEAARAFSTVHDGAIYLHLGRSYGSGARSRLPARALLSRSPASTSRRPSSESMTYIDRLPERRETHGVTLSFGTVVYSETVIGYQRKAAQDHTVIDFQSLDMPTSSSPTRALWYELDELIDAEPFPPEHLLGALHALEHGQIAVLPLIAMCDRWDIGGLSTNAHPQTGGPTIFIYDGHPGGVGITRRGFDQFERLVRDAQRLIGECPCRVGLPLVRAVAQVRQPQRAAVEGGGAGAARASQALRCEADAARRGAHEPTTSAERQRLRPRRRRPARAQPAAAPPRASERQRGKRAGRELALDLDQFSCASAHRWRRRHATGQLQHQHLHRRVVADHHHRAGLGRDPAQALDQLTTARSYIGRSIRCSPPTRDALERLSACDAPSSTAPTLGWISLAAMYVSQHRHSASPRGASGRSWSSFAGLSQLDFAWRSTYKRRSSFMCVLSSSGGVRSSRDAFAVGPIRARRVSAGSPAQTPPPSPPDSIARHGEIAQLVEHTTENRGVPGSSPGLAIPWRTPC